MPSKAYQIWSIGTPLTKLFAETEVAILDGGSVSQNPGVGSEPQDRTSIRSAIYEALGAILNATSESARGAHAKQAAQDRIIGDLIHGDLIAVGSTTLEDHIGPTYQLMPASFWQELEAGEVDWSMNAAAQGDREYRNIAVIAKSDPRVLEIQVTRRGRPSHREAIEEAVEIALAADLGFAGWQNSKQVGHVLAILKAEFPEIDFSGGGLDKTTLRKTINAYLK